MDVNVMNMDTQWVVDAFIEECSNLKPSDYMYVWRRRQKLAEMVLTELDLDFLGCVELQAWAAAMLDLCQEPGNVGAWNAVNAAQAAYVEVLRAASPS
jgi:hypothetical protein